MKIKIVTDPAIQIMTILMKNIMRGTVMIKELLIETIILETVIKITTHSLMNLTKKIKNSFIDDI